MDDWFLQRGKAKLAVAEILGFLDRWIRRSLRELSNEELWGLVTRMHRRCGELALLDSPEQKTPSMGARFREWKSYPLKKYLDEEESLRYDERAAANPELYRTPFNHLSNEELDDYSRWYGLKPPDSVDHLTPEELYSMWKRERHRVLPVLPRPGSLPSNIHARRPDHKEGSRRPQEVPKKADQKEDPPPNGKADKEGRFEIQEDEVH